MKATIKRTELIRLINDVSKIVPKRSSMPAIETLYVSAAGKSVIASGTDLYTIVTGGIKARVETEGEACLAIKSTLAFLKAVDAETVTLETDGKAKDKVAISAGAAKAAVVGARAEDYPKEILPNTFTGDAVRVTGLAEALSEVTYACAKEESRPILTGVYLDQKDKGPLAVAADGFRLATSKFRATGKLTPVIIPLAAAKILEAMAKGKVDVRYDGEKDKMRIQFVNNGYIITTSLITGTYPNYEQLIPKNGKRCVVDPKEMLKALKVVSITAGGSQITRMLASNGQMLVKTIDENTGSTEFTIPAAGNIKMAVNLSYLADLLRRTSEKVTLQWNKSESPLKVIYNGTLHLLMPMFVAWD